MTARRKIIEDEAPIQGGVQPPQDAPATLNKPNFQSQIKFINSIIDNMLSGANKRMMIGGDTGLGKSSFVKQFAKIFGFPTIIVEIPHTVEEHLINIPFITFDTNGNKQQGYDQLEKGDGVTITMGTSHLASALRKLSKIPNEQFKAKQQSYDVNTKELISQFEEEFPGRIAAVRARYDRVLFLDEYFRQTTPAIRNILRNVLNGRIGNDVIPAGTYVMYASNLEDVGGSMDAQSQHTSFLNKKFAAPTKDQWLHYTVSKAVSGNVHFKQPVIDAFNKHMNDSHVSFNDVATGIRTSPRRWSEIILYINNAFPFKSPEEAGIIVTTLKRQFQTDEGDSSVLFGVLQNILNDLTIQSKIDPKSVRPISPVEWRKVLAHQVMTSIALGDQKKYVPVIQGLPGVGKTAIGETFSRPPYNLRFIPILATTLTRDSVVGIPLPDKQKDETGVRFAEPELYIMIMNQIKEAEKEYIAQLKKQESSGKLGGKTAEEAYEEYQLQPFKYLIFFDEINRVKDVAIFNSLRRIILEKEFNDQYKLPKGSIVVGAMNPSDLGTIPLTSHFRDAIELIDVEPNWNDTLKFIKNQVIPYLIKLNNPSDISLETAEKIITAFPATFTDRKAGRHSNEFYVNAGVDEVYLSPRDYDNMFREIVMGIDSSVKSITHKINKGARFTDDQINALIGEAAFDKLEATLSERFYQAQIGDPPGFMDKVQQFLDSIIDVSLTKKTSNQGLSGILDSVLSTNNPLKDDFDFDNYMSSYMPATFSKDLVEFFNDKFGHFAEEDLPTTLKEMVQIAKEIKEAVDQNSFDPDILDRVDNVSFDFLNNLLKGVKLVNKSSITTVAEAVGKCWQTITHILGH